MSIGERLKAVGVKSADEVRSTAIWQGPVSPEWNGGVTFSLLARFLQCRDRFRCYAIEGLKPRAQFNHRIEYGNYFHLCEQYAQSEEGWEFPLFQYVQQLCRKYPMQQDDIIKWYNVCKVQFPIYKEYWSKCEKKDQYKTLFTEDVFDVMYILPSGRIVRLRGKRDKGLIEGNGDWWLCEHKTKGDIDSEAIPRQLTFDLQTMLYVVAIQETRYQEPLINQIPKGSRFAGVIYNCVRRPLSGGKGTIVRHKATKNKPEETYDSFYRRLKGIIDGSGEDAPGPDQFFYRWEVKISQHDIEMFKTECLNPLLEQLYSWYEGQIGIKNSTPIAPWMLHYRQPYGVPSLEDLGGSPYDRYLETGDSAGLEHVDTMFEELKQ